MEVSDKEGNLIFVTYFNGTVKHILHMHGFLRIPVNNVI